MATIHAFVQSKTTGKSLLAAFLAQYLRNRRGQRVQCVDTEMMFSSFSEFADLHVEMVEVKELPAYCRSITPEIAHVVIDTRVSGFFPFCNQLRASLLPVLEKAGHTLLLHTVVTGGGQLVETYNGFNSLAENFPELPFIVWLNPHYGEIAANGKTFEESGVYLRHKKAAVRSLVRMPVPLELTSEDVRDIYTRHLTFREAQEGTVFSIMVKQRLKSYREKLFAELDTAALCEPAS
jgi:hypothetical protein